MKYNQPYGVSDPNAAYINGNPSTGTMGSIPPAASIEYPQREIVALIAAAGLTPDNADLAQAAQSDQARRRAERLQAGTNGGTASHWSMTCPTLPIMPPPVGTAVWFKPGLASVNGGTTVLAQRQRALCRWSTAISRPIAHRRHRRERLAAAVLRRRALAGACRIDAPFGVLPLLFAITDWYVNGTTGDDAAYDGTAATHTGGNHGPFRTLQRAAERNPEVQHERLSISSFMSLTMPMPLWR